MMSVVPSQKKVATIASPFCGLWGSNPFLIVLDPAKPAVPFHTSRAMPPPAVASKRGVASLSCSGPEESVQLTARRTAINRPRPSHLVECLSIVPTLRGVCETHRPTVTPGKVSKAPPVGSKVQAKRCTLPAQRSHRGLPGESGALAPRILWPRCNNGASNSLGTSVAQGAHQLAHAAFDPLVYLVEHRAALIHRVAHSPHLDRLRIEVPQDHHVDRPAPEALAHETTLNRVHHHDEIGRAQQLDGDET